MLFLSQETKGEVFGQNVRVNSFVDFDQIAPEVEVSPNGTIFVAWWDTRIDDGDIYIAWSSDGGSSFKGDTKINDDGGTSKQQNPSIAVDSAGAVYTVWGDWRDDADGKRAVGGGLDGVDNQNIYFSKSPDGGQSWTPNLRINEGNDTSESYYPRIAIDGSGNIHVVWSDPFFGINTSVFYAKSTDAGMSFCSAKKVDDAERDARDGDIATDSKGNIYVVWEDGRNERHIYFSRSTDGGGTFEPNRRVSDIELDADPAPKIAVGGGVLGISWEQGLDGIYFANSSDDGNTFTVRGKISDNQGWTAPHVAINSTGYIAVAWTDGREGWGNDDIYLSTSYDEGATFSISQRINDDISVKNQRIPSVAMDQNGYTYVVWMDERSGVDYDVYFARSPPWLPDLAVSSSDINFIPSGPISYGTDVLINATIHNIGEENATDIVVRFYDDEISASNLIGEFIILRVEKGNHSWAEASWTAIAPRFHEICVVVDPENNITESNESNNQACRTIEVILPQIPDLSLTPEDVAFDKPPPFVNGSFVRINATIHNIGGANASNVPIRFMDNPFGQIEGDKVIPFIATDGTGFAEVEWNTTPTGFHEICVSADPENEIAELDETNNDACILVEATEMSIPLPPSNLNAFLGGNNHENVTLLWNLSQDDGAGKNNVARYDVYRGSVYDSSGSSYLLHASLSAGTSSYVDTQTGEGNPNDYFYVVCATSDSNLSSCSLNQAGKFTRPLSEGPKLVSIPLIQSNESIEKVLRTVKFDKAWTYDSPGGKWKWYMTFKPYKGMLRTINHTVGIWTNVTVNCNLTVAGIVPLTAAIQLKQGWNLVGFPSFEENYTGADLILKTNATEVEGFSSSSFPYYLAAIQDMEKLRAGFGYWIKVPEDTLWLISN